MINAALIGLGNIAWKYDANKLNSLFALSQAGAIMRRSDMRLLGGCSPNLEDCKAFEKWAGLPYYQTPEALLGTLQPDFVGICSPTALHYEHVKLCLERGVKIIWLEKPPAENVWQVNELAQLAEGVQATVCVNYFRRYLPQYQKLRAILQNQMVGKCHSLRILYSPGISSNGIHLLDQIFFLTGASQYDLLWVETGGVADNPSFALRLDNGLLVQGCGAAVPYHTNDISLVCDGGVFSVIRGGKQARLEQRVPNGLFPGFYEAVEQDASPAESISLDGYLDAALDDLLESHISGHLPQSNLVSAALAQGLLEEILHRSRA